MRNLILSNAHSVHGLRLMMSYPYINFLSRYFTETQEYEAGLDFVDRCLETIRTHAAEITPKEHEKWERYFESLRTGIKYHIARKHRPLTPERREKRLHDLDVTLRYMHKVWKKEMERK